jgi:hypothetical protein
LEKKINEASGLFTLFWRQKMTEITYMHRIKAKQIIADLRKNWSRVDIARKFKIRPDYVSFVEHMHRRSDNKEIYLAPADVIKEILAHEPQK